jgi:hypothetical protein
VTQHANPLPWLLSLQNKKSNPSWRLRVLSLLMCLVLCMFDERGFVCILQESGHAVQDALHSCGQW